MPIVDWGISQGVMDDFDREKQARYAPYTGPKPPSAVYRFRIEQMLFKGDDEEKLPQWLALLTLVPRYQTEKKYKGYKVWFSASVGDNNAFAYTPMCDVLGISEREFRTRFKTDDEGKVISIGKWRMDGKQEILAEIVDNVDQNTGRVFTNVRWVGDVSEDQSDLDDEESDLDDEDDEDDADEFEDDAEEEEAPRRRPAKRAAKATSRTSRSKSRRTRRDEDDF